MEAKIEESKSSLKIPMSEAVNTLANRQMTTYSVVVQTAANTNLIVPQSFIFRANMIPLHHRGDS